MEVALIVAASKALEALQTAQADLLRAWSKAQGGPVAQLLSEGCPLPELLGAKGTSVAEWAGSAAARLRVLIKDEPYESCASCGWVGTASEAVDLFCDPGCDSYTNMPTCPSCGGFTESLKLNATDEKDGGDPHG